MEKTNTKVTKRDNFAAIIEILAEQGRDDLVKVMEHEVELLNKKSGKPSNSKSNKLNVAIGEKVMAVLADDEERSATQILALIDTSDIDGIENISLPRLSAVLKKLGKDGKIDRLQDKKKVTFRLGTGLGYEEEEADAE